MDHVEWWQFFTSSHVKAWLKLVAIHLKLYGKRVQELKDGVENLKKKRDAIQQRVEEEKNRYGRGITVEVKEWIEAVDEIISEYEDFNEDERHEHAMYDFFESGYLPKPGIRYRLSIQALDISKKVNGLLEKANHETISYWLGPLSMAAFLSIVGYEKFPSRDEIVKKIEVALEDPKVRMIGLHGLSGVGKTSLVKNVAKEALDEKKFDVVTMASVTRNADIRKIQGQIADMLGMKLDEESDIARAARIRERLKNQKKSTLIILDDLWAKLDFNMLGIPSENDDDDDGRNSVNLMKTEPGASNMMKSKNPPGTSYMRKTEETLKGCKVFLISETKQVLLGQMEGKENFIFCLEVLKDKEAETLFKKKAGIGDTNSEFVKLAAQIARKCGGLPMSVVTTARALKNQSSLVWEDVNRNLERQKLTGAPEFSTKLSYDLLENEELKYTFLLCARMDQDALIMDLVKYCIGLGFLQGIYRVKEARNRVYALVGKLKESGLLSDSYSSDHFTMQDIVRNAALSIASEEKKHVLTMTKGIIDEWPDEDKLERYDAISLQHCDIIEGFPSIIKCPRLRVFHVNNSDPNLKIPENFFQEMKELRVLILTGFHLSPLPPSIACLTKLRMLCLEQCVLGEELSIIGKLKNLRILSLSGSDLKKLPAELKRLTKLQIFDISNCFKLKEIPSNVINCLTSLEELYMRKTLIRWNIEGQINRSKKADLSELMHLKELTTLDIQISDVGQLPNDLFFDKLNSYKIVIGDLKAYLETDFKIPEKYEMSRFLAIQLEDCFDIHSQMGIKMLFDRVENLLLEDLNGVQDIFYRLNLKGFPYLKHLSIVSNFDIQSLINPEDRLHSEKTFPKLESLFLYNLKKMDKICSCELSKPSFGKLKVLKIYLCSRLKNVFSISVVRLLTVLETIEVSECNSLKEIVPVEMQSDKIERLEFPELRSLTLQSLPQFIGFYPISSTGGDDNKLFHEEVVFSKLERMELSSIQIDIIWNEEPSLDSYFRNLIQLDVNGCQKLKFLLSFSMAESLVNLQSFFISDCEKMEHIFQQGRGCHAKMKGILFPNLKNIKLSSMRSLTEIWNVEFPSDSFGKLDTLILDQCAKLDKVFPCNVEGNIFWSLCNLRVTNCRSMKEIFDLDNIKQDAGDVNNLQDVHLEALPKLKHVWKMKEYRERILNLKKLQKILVHDCDSLEYIFPVSEAMYLENLEYLVVRDCLRFGEIIGKGKDTNTIKFVFPKLITIKFLRLPRLESFYPGDYELSCPVLNYLCVEHCDKLEPFKKETADTQRKRNPFPPKEVINQLKSMQIESWHAKSSSSYMGKRNYRWDNLEELSLSRLMNIEILYSFLHSNPNLKSLSLSDCSFKKMVPFKRPPVIQTLGVVPKLRSLKLIDLPKLEKIGFEPDIVLQRIEFLILESCPSLVTIVPSSVSLTHLTILEVVNCNRLEYLMPPRTAKNLTQLRTMKVIKCESLKEIVGNEEEKAYKVDIVFRQLKALELVSLKNLESFCSSKTCIIEFPALEKLVVSACPKMETFSEEVTSAPILQKIYVVHEHEKRWHWCGNLNDTIKEMFEEKKFFEGMDEMNFSEHSFALSLNWRRGIGLRKSRFYSLKTLKLVNCEVGSHAIPSHVLPFLNSLKELEVRDCNDVRVIFEKNYTEIMETASHLRNLILQGLPELTHVWEIHDCDELLSSRGKNSQGFIRFQNLQQVFVSGCQNLKALFPVALVKKLNKLEKLEIKSCDELKEIVEKEEEDTTEVEEFLFPSLTSLDLYNLPKLTYFYSEIFTLECPELNDLRVLGCLQLELFQSGRKFFLDLKAISNLEVLMLDWKHTCELRSMFGKFTEELKYLNELYLYFNSYGNVEHTLPFEILEKAPNLESMLICDCSDPRIFITQKPKIGEHLKNLTLYRVSELQSIGSEGSSWLNTICEKLHKLNVYECPDLTTLVHSAVSFSHVRGLYISNCLGLKYLFTSSATKRLIHLEEITVEDCESIEEIVAEEDIDENEIIFGQLKTLTLTSLPKLGSFYPGISTLKFPSLKEVLLTQCHSMEVFGYGDVVAEELEVTIDGVYWEGDINDAVKQQLRKEADRVSIMTGSHSL